MIINKKYWKLGIACEVTKALINFTKENKIKGLIIECADKQEVTKHIASKNGFKFVSEGELWKFEKMI